MRSFTVYLLILASSIAQAELIPAPRLADWSTNCTGVPGGIPARTALIDVTKPPYHVDNTGATDVRDALHDILVTAPSNSVVYLPAGTYRVDNYPLLVSGEVLKSYYTLRGAGTGTVIRVTGQFLQIGAGVDWGSSYPAPSNHIVSGFQKGSSNLVLEAALPASYVGGLMWLYQSNDVGVVHSQAPYQGLQQQKVSIQAIAGNTVTVWPPVIFDMKASLGPAVKAAPPYNLAKFAGVEDMVIEATNSTASAILGMDEAYGCWIKGVEIHHICNYGITMYNSLRCEVRDSRIDTAQSTGPNHGGLILYWTSGLLAENNIFRRIFPSIEVNQGSSGNVFGYNLCLDADDATLMGMTIDSNHGPHNSFNLYEGNKAQNLQADGYFGSVSHDTIFRNWFTGTNSSVSQNSKCINLNRWAYNYNVVGNVLGTPDQPWTLSNANGTAGYSTRYIYCFGLPNIGNGTFNGKYGPPLLAPDYQEMDTNIAWTLILKGNWDYATKGVPSNQGLGTDPLPSSLYRSSKPAWWGALPWPAFGPDAALTNLIPAEARYAGLAVPARTNSAPSTGLAAPIPKLLNPTWSGNQFSARVSTTAGFSYYLEYQQAPGSSSWIVVAQVAGDGTVRILTDPSATDPRRLYRVRVQ